MTTKELSRRQVRWSEFLSQFDFVIKSRPGKDNAKADSLIRRSQDLLKNDSDPRTQHQKQTFLPANKFHDTIIEDLAQSEHNFALNTTHLSYLSSASLSKPKDEPSDQKISRLLDQGYQVETDQWLKNIVAELTKPEGIPHSKEISLSECELHGGQLHYRDRICVPDNELRQIGRASCRERVYCTV